jgi:hypothetical protein
MVVRLGKNLMLLTNKECKFCSKKQSELNLFCVSCNRRDWEVGQIKNSDLDKREIYLKCRFQTMIQESRL